MTTHPIFIAIAPLDVGYKNRRRGDFAPLPKKQNFYLSLQIDEPKNIVTKNGLEYKAPSDRPIGKCIVKSHRLV